MILNKLLVSGFRSIKYLDLDLKSQGISFIQGFNGAGKSTIFEAIFYGLYGEAVKNTLGSQIVTLKEYRDAEFKGTCVHLHLTIGIDTYLFRRYINYGSPSRTDTVIYKNNIPVPVENKTDAQEKITKILGISPELFRQSVFFAQKSLRIVDKKDADRRDVFEELFDIDISKYAEHARVKAGEYNSKFEEKLSDSKIAEQKQAGISKNITDVNAYINNFDLQKQAELLEVQKRIDGLKYEIANLPKDDAVELVAPEEVDVAELQKKSSEYQRLNTEIATLDYQLKYLPEISTICNTCQQPLQQHLVEQLSAERDIKVTEKVDKIKELSLNLPLLQADLSKLENQRAGYLTKYREYTVLQMQAQANINKRSQVLKSLEHESKLYEALDAKKCPYTPEYVAKLETELQHWHQTFINAEQDKTIIEKEMRAYSYWSTIGFSNKGMKAYVIQALLVKLNKALMKYGQTLGIYVNIDIKTDTKSKAFSIKITQDEVEKDYSSLSGGEQKRVDVIVSFALHDILPVKVSLMVMDEIFEGLDEQGLTSAMSLIQEKSKDHGVYIISHNPNIDIGGADIIYIKKENNFTVIE